MRSSAAPPSPTMCARSRRYSMALESSDAHGAPQFARRLKQGGIARWLAQSWLAILFFVFFFAFWETSIDLFKIPPYILNKPSEIVTRGWADVDRLVYYTGVTGLETIIGYVIAIVIAVPLGLAI